MSVRKLERRRPLFVFSIVASLLACLCPVRADFRINEYDDVRWRNLSQLDLNNRSGLIRTLWFNEDTVWPPADKMPPGCDPKKIMRDAMNPGLGLRELHAQGITGKGVTVAIIDEPIYLDHPEFAGRIVAYLDTGCGGGKRSMHGPAVASLLAGKNIGTAPDAGVYYAAVQTAQRDASYYAKALEWIVAENGKLPPGRKIRVVSVSGRPSGPSPPATRFKYHQEMWDQAYDRATEAGILVLDCTIHHGLLGPCWYEPSDPENVARCTPGYPGTQPNWFEHSDPEAVARWAAGQFGTSYPKGLLLVVCSPRTTAEQYEAETFSYQYDGRGGLSWGIPYGAGVLALGWQLRPELTPGQMVELLFKSACVKDGHKIINPKEFVRLVREYKGS